MEYKYDHESLQIMHEEWLDMRRSGIVTDEELREIEDIIFGDENEIVYSDEDETDPEEEEETATT